MKVRTKQRLEIAALVAVLGVCAVVFVWGAIKIGKLVFSSPTAGWWILGITTIGGLAVFAGLGLIRLIRKGWAKLSVPTTNPTNPNPQGDDDFVGEKMPLKYWAIIALIYFAYFGIFLILTGIAMIIIGWFGSAIMVFALSFATVYTVGSFARVDSKKIAAKTFFGKAIQRLGSGLVFVPRGIFDVVYLPKGIIGFHIGQIRNKKGEAEEEEYQSDLTFSTKAPFRVMFKQDDDPKKAEADPLKRQQTTDPNVVILLHITDPVQFINNVGGLETAYDNVRDAVTVTFQEYCGKVTLREALSTLHKAVNAIKDTVENLIGDPDAKRPVKGGRRWGVNIIKIGIPSLGLSFDVNSAISSATAAGYEKIALTEQGVGNANARRESLLADAAGQTAIAQGLQQVELDLARSILAAQAYEQGLKGANYSVVPGGDLFGMLAAGKQVLDSLQTAKPKGQGQTVPVQPTQGGASGNKPRKQSQRSRQGNQRGKAGGTNPQPGTIPQGSPQTASKQKPKSGGPTPTPTTP